MESGSTALVVDKENHRLSLYRCQDGRPVLVRSYQATTGKGIGDKEAEGDQKTPEGIYFFTRFIDGARLPSEYGVGAIVMDYPNTFDRLAGKGGDGIWLHATDEPERINEPYTTRGCVVVRNEHFGELKRSVVPLYTPIIVAKRIEDLPLETIEKRRAELEKFLESWRSAWVRADTGAYLSHYSAYFRGRGMNYGRFAAHKRSVFGRSKDIRVAATDVQIFRLDERAVIHFFQDFRSSLMANAGYKTLHIARTPAGWKIVGEEWEPLSSFRPYPAVLARASFPAPPPSQQRPSPTVVASTPVTTTPPSPPPAVATKVVATTSAVSLLGADTRVVSIDGLQITYPQPGSMEVSFELRKSSPAYERVTGRLAVLVNLEAGAERRTVAYPAMSEPTRIPLPGLFAGGEYYSIRWLKIVHALIKLPAGAVYSPVSVKVCVFDKNRKPLLIKDYPLSSGGTSSAASTTAEMSWKAKS